MVGADEKPAVVSFGTGKDGSDTSFGAQMFNLSFMLTVHKIYLSDIKLKVMFVRLNENVC